MNREDALRSMGLGLDATEADIKRRFHALAFGANGRPGAHPDKGGSAEQFALLSLVYRAARSQPVTRKQARKYVKRDTVVDALEIGVVLADVLEKPKVAALLKQVLQGLTSKG